MSTSSRPGDNPLLLDETPPMRSNPLRKFKGVKGRVYSGPTLRPGNLDLFSSNSYFPADPIDGREPANSYQIPSSASSSSKSPPATIEGSPSASSTNGVLRSVNPSSSPPSQLETTATSPMHSFLASPHPSASIGLANSKTSIGNQEPFYIDQNGRIYDKYYQILSDAFVIVSETAHQDPLSPRGSTPTHSGPKSLSPPTSPSSDSKNGSQGAPLNLNQSSSASNPSSANQIAVTSNTSTSLIPPKNTHIYLPPFPEPPLEQGSTTYFEYEHEVLLWRDRVLRKLEGYKLPNSVGRHFYRPKQASTHSGYLDKHSTDGSVSSPSTTNLPQITSGTPSSSGAAAVSAAGKSEAKTSSVIAGGSVQPSTQGSGSANSPHIRGSASPPGGGALTHRSTSDEADLANPGSSGDIPWDVVVTPPEPNPANYSSYKQYSASMVRWSVLIAQSSYKLPPSPQQLPDLLKIPSHPPIIFHPPPQPWSTSTRDSDSDDSSSEASTDDVKSNENGSSNNVNPTERRIKMSEAQKQKMKAKSKRSSSPVQHVAGNITSSNGSTSKETLQSPLHQQENASERMMLALISMMIIGGSSFSPNLQAKSIQRSHNSGKSKTVVQFQYSSKTSSALAQYSLISKSSKLVYLPVSFESKAPWFDPGKQIAISRVSSSIPTFAATKSLQQRNKTIQHGGIVCNILPTEVVIDPSLMPLNQSLILPYDVTLETMQNLTNWSPTSERVGFIKTEYVAYHPLRDGRFDWSLLSKSNSSILPSHAGIYSLLSPQYMLSCASSSNRYIVQIPSIPSQYHLPPISITKFGKSMNFIAPIYWISPFSDTRQIKSSSQHQSSEESSSTDNETNNSSPNGKSDTTSGTWRSSLPSPTSSSISKSSKSSTSTVNTSTTNTHSSGSKPHKFSITTGSASSKPFNLDQAFDNLIKSQFSRQVKTGRSGHDRMTSDSPANSGVGYPLINLKQLMQATAEQKNQIIETQQILNWIAHPSRNKLVDLPYSHLTPLTPSTSAKRATLQTSPVSLPALKPWIEGVFGRKSSSDASDSKSKDSSVSPIFKFITECIGCAPLSSTVALSSNEKKYTGSSSSSNLQNATDQILTTLSVLDVPSFISLISTDYTGNQSKDNENEVEEAEAVAKSPSSKSILYVFSKWIFPSSRRHRRATSAASLSQNTGPSSQDGTGKLTDESAEQILTKAAHFIQLLQLTEEIQNPQALMKLSYLIYLSILARRKASCEIITSLLILLSPPQLLMNDMEVDPNAETISELEDSISPRRSYASGKKSSPSARSKSSKSSKGASPRGSKSSGQDKTATTTTTTSTNSDSVSGTGHKISWAQVNHSLPSRIHTQTHHAHVDGLISSLIFILNYSRVNPLDIYTWNKQEMIENILNRALSSESSSVLKMIDAEIELILSIDRAYKAELIAKLIDEAVPEVGLTPAQSMMAARSANAAALAANRERDAALGASPLASSSSNIGSMNSKEATRDFSNAPNMYVQGLSSSSSIHAPFAKFSSSLSYPLPNCDVHTELLNQLNDIWMREATFVLHLITKISTAVSYSSRDDSSSDDSVTTEGGMVFLPTPGTDSKSKNNTVSGSSVPSPTRMSPRKTSSSTAANLETSKDKDKLSSSKASLAASTNLEKSAASTGSQGSSHNDEGPKLIHHMLGPSALASRSTSITSLSLFCLVWILRIDLKIEFWRTVCPHLSPQNDASLGHLIRQDSMEDGLNASNSDAPSGAETAGNQTSQGLKQFFASGNNRRTSSLYQNNPIAINVTFDTLGGQMRLALQHKSAKWVSTIESLFRSKLTHIRISAGRLFDICIHDDFYASNHPLPSTVNAHLNAMLNNVPKSLSKSNSSFSPAPSAIAHPEPWLYVWMSRLGTKAIFSGFSTGMKSRSSNSSSGYNSMNPNTRHHNHPHHHNHPGHYAIEPSKLKPSDIPSFAAQKWFSLLWKVCGPVMMIEHSISPTMPQLTNQILNFTPVNQSNSGGAVTGQQSSSSLNTSGLGTSSSQASPSTIGTSGSTGGSINTSPTGLHSSSAAILNISPSSTGNLFSSNTNSVGAGFGNHNSVANSNSYHSRVNQYQWNNLGSTPAKPNMFTYSNVPKWIYPHIPLSSSSQTLMAHYIYESGTVDKPDGVSLVLGVSANPNQARWSWDSASTIRSINIPPMPPSIVNVGQSVGGLKTSSSAIPSLSSTTALNSPNQILISPCSMDMNSDLLVTTDIPLTCIRDSKLFHRLFGKILKCDPGQHAQLISSSLLHLVSSLNRHYLTMPPLPSSSGGTSLHSSSGSISAPSVSTSSNPLTNPHSTSVKHPPFTHGSSSGAIGSSNNSLSSNPHEHVQFAAQQIQLLELVSKSVMTFNADHLMRLLVFIASPSVNSITNALGPLNPNLMILHPPQYAGQTASMEKSNAYQVRTNMIRVLQSIITCVPMVSWLHGNISLPVAGQGVAPVSSSVISRQNSFRELGKYSTNSDSPRSTSRGRKSPNLTKSEHELLSSSSNQIPGTGTEKSMESSLEESSESTSTSKGRSHPPNGAGNNTTSGTVSPARWNKSATPQNKFQVPSIHIAGSITPPGSPMPSHAFAKIEPTVVGDCSGILIMSIMESLLAVIRFGADIPSAMAAAECLRSLVYASQKTLDVLLKPIVGQVLQFYAPLINHFQRSKMSNSSVNASSIGGGSTDSFLKAASAQETFDELVNLAKMSHTRGSSTSSSFSSSSSGSSAFIGYIPTSSSSGSLQSIPLGSSAPSLSPSGIAGSSSSSGTSNQSNSAATYLSVLNSMPSSWLLCTSPVPPKSPSKASNGTIGNNSNTPNFSWSVPSVTATMPSLLKLHASLSIGHSTLVTATLLSHLIDGLGVSHSLLHVSNCLYALNQLFAGPMPLQTGNAAAYPASSHHQQQQQQQASSSNSFGSSAVSNSPLANYRSDAILSNHQNCSAWIAAQNNSNITLNSTKLHKQFIAFFVSQHMLFKIHLVYKRLCEDPYIKSLIDLYSRDLSSFTPASSSAAGVGYSSHQHHVSDGNINTSSGATASAGTVSTSTMNASQSSPNLSSLGAINNSSIVNHHNNSSSNSDNRTSLGSNPASPSGKSENKEEKTSSKAGKFFSSIFKKDKSSSKELNRSDSTSNVNSGGRDSSGQTSTTSPSSPTPSNSGSLQKDKSSASMSKTNPPHKPQQHTKIERSLKFNTVTPTAASPGAYSAFIQLSALCHTFYTTYLCRKVMKAAKANPEYIAAIKLLAKMAPHKEQKDEKNVPLPTNIINALAASNLV